jgi:riboflavin synthase
MFTGIILAIGKVERIEALGGDYQLTFNTGQLSLDDVNIGDSIAVNGVCLTAVELTANSFSADVSRETLSRTTLGQIKPGSSVNLELALAPTTRLGGHFVSGHVDALGTVLRKEQDGRSFRFDIKVPQIEVDVLARYLERLIQGDQSVSDDSKITALLNNAGFIKG